MAYNIPEYLDVANEAEYLSLIQEVQFENPKLKKVEELFRELRAEYMGYNSRLNTINANPLIKDISLLMEEIFGFYSFQLSIDQNRIPNAYTAAISSKIDAWNYKKCVVKSNQGIKFTAAGRVNTAAYITTGLLLDPKFTDREIVAILLHEIGHNFSDSINKTLGVFSNFKKVLMIPSIFTNPQHVSNTFRKTATEFNDYMRKNSPEMVSAFGALKLFIGDISYIILTLNRAISTIPYFAVSNMYNVLTNAMKQVMQNPIGFSMKTIFSFFGKEDEYTSDSFVAMYGYGPDLSSGLLKLERHNLTPTDEAFKEGDFGAMWFAFFVESVDMINTLINNSHPATAKRLLNILDTLEKEYSKDYINPKFKKETKKEIDEIRKLINEEIQNNSFDGNYWRIAWNKHILATKPNKGPKDKMIEDILDKINQFDEY